MAIFSFTTTNAAPVGIPDATNSTPNVPGLISQSVNVFVAGTIQDVNFTVSGLTHTWANDLDMVLFGPNTANNLVLMSDVGGSSDLSNTTLTFDDAGSSNFLNNNTSIGSGTYRPTNHSVNTGGNVNPNETAAQFGFASTTLNNPGPTGGATLATAFNGSNAAGTWTFAVSDDGSGDLGSFGNWSLQLQTLGSSTIISGSSSADTLNFASLTSTSGDMVYNGTLAAYSGLDTIFFNTGGGLDVVVGGAGSENIIEADALDGDNFNGGAGFDTIDYSNVSFISVGYTSVVFDLALGDVTSNTGATDTIQDFENVTASDTNDTVFGNASANVVRGEGGNDDLNGNDGIDVLIGGAGNDTLEGGSDVDQLSGGVGDDVFQLFVQGDDGIGETLDGGSDFDTIIMSSVSSYTYDLGNDFLSEIERLWLDTDAGSAGQVIVRASQINGTNLATNLRVTGNANPTITDRLIIEMGAATTLDISGFIMTEFGGPSDLVIVEAGLGVNYNIRSTNGSDVIFASVGADLLYGMDGLDSIYGDNGADNLWGGLGADQHFGGDDASIDYARYDDANYGNLTIRLDGVANVGAAAVGDTYDGVEGLVGGLGADTVVGNASANYLFGGGSADGIYGQGGADYLSGDAGGDNLWGGAGADSHIGGNDVGIDYARYDDANWGNLTIRLDAPASNVGAVALGDTYTGIEGLVGGLGNDTVVGNGSANYLFGGGGADNVYGQAGADYLSGDAGGDNLWGGAGADQHIGGNDAGVDYARYDDANWGNLTIRLDAPASNVGAVAVGDTYTGIEGLVGGLGNDVVIGNASANYLFGGGANDYIDGRAGNDYLSGGAGADRFVFNLAFGATNMDTIADFVHLTDDIVLSQTIFAGIGATLDASEFQIGTADAATDRIIYNNVTGQLFYDSNGNTVGGMTQFASVTAGTVLSVADFVMV
jgi:Ca2+-binding RTX toxin-like protein/subtilisin-like proprotein convertase family protein